MGDIGERTNEALASLQVMLVMFCRLLERWLRLGVGELEEGWCLEVELVQEMKAEGRR